MYGYVRPCKPELRIKEWERYQAAYCGLCHTLKKRYGLLAPEAGTHSETLPSVEIATVPSLISGSVGPPYSASPVHVLPESAENCKGLMVVICLYELCEAKSTVRAAHIFTSLPLLCA